MYVGGVLQMLDIYVGINLVDLYVGGVFQMWHEMLARAKGITIVSRNERNGPWAYHFMGLLNACASVEAMEEGMCNF